MLNYVSAYARQAGCQKRKKNLGISWVKRFKSERWILVIGPGFSRCIAEGNRGGEVLVDVVSRREMQKNRTWWILQKGWK